MLYQPTPNPFYIGQVVVHPALRDRHLTITRYWSERIVAVLDWDTDGEFSAYVTSLTAVQ